MLTHCKLSNENVQNVIKNGGAHFADSKKMRMRTTSIGYGNCIRKCIYEL